ncbi:hypothetical protein HK098_007059 [Nowakowskiella sp. JEL0407]|nr:hypothetical protein HK098_007059 [Nowakowskiella sp. JEL0407]
MTKVTDFEAQLEKIISNLKDLQSKGNYKSDDITKIQESIHAIDESWNNAAVKEADGSIAAGQAVLSDMLNDAHELASDLLAALPDE